MLQVDERVDDFLDRFALRKLDGNAERNSVRIEETFRIGNDQRQLRYRKPRCQLQPQWNQCTPGLSAVERVGVYPLEIIVPEKLFE